MRVYACLMTNQHSHAHRWLIFMATETCRQSSLVGQYQCVDRKKQHKNKEKPLNISYKKVAMWTDFVSAACNNNEGIFILFFLKDIYLYLSIAQCKCEAVCVSDCESINKLWLAGTSGQCLPCCCWWCWWWVWDTGNRFMSTHWLPGVWGACV